MENPENVLMELSLLEKNPQCTAISPCLDNYLAYVAKSGNALFAWAKVKPLFKRKLELIIQEFQETSPTDNLPLQPNVDVFHFDQMKERIFEQLENYTGIPFTVQRLCELIVQPKKHYKRTDKFMRGLEKIMLVVSTIDPNPNSQDEASKQETSECSFESPSKRMRLAIADNESSRVSDSAEASSIAAAVAVEIVPDLDVAGPSSQPDTPLSNSALVSTINSNGDVANDVDTGEESMDIDTECTSSQARLTPITDSSSDTAMVVADTGVESSAEAAHNEATPDNIEIDTEITNTNSVAEAMETGVESSSSDTSAPVQVQEDVSDGVTASDGVSTSVDQSPNKSEVSLDEVGAASSSDVVQKEAALGGHSEDPSKEDTNSEAEPAEAEQEAGVDNAAKEDGPSVEVGDVSEVVPAEVCDPIVSESEPNQTNQVESVESSAQSSSQISVSESCVVEPGQDSGAADSSDQAQVPTAPCDSHVTTDSSCQPSTSDIVNSAPSEQTQETDNSPDQSDSSVQ